MLDKPKAHLLVVDDDVRNLRLLESLLAPEGYHIMLAISGEEALVQVAERKPDLILLDAMMPGMNGFEVAGKLKQDDATKSIPIIMVTSLNDKASRLLALNLGAEDFLTKPIDRAELWVRVRNLLRLKEYNDFLAEHAHTLEVKVYERTTQLTASYRQTIETLSRASSYRDETTGSHVNRISHFCVELAQVLGADSDFRDCIFYASPMHDVGKLAIPDRILLKQGYLDSDEWEIMKEHAALGAKLLEGGNSPYLIMGRQIAMSHHERWDGTGYPQGLTGEDIPLGARLMSIADVYDALRSRRPYKEAYDHEKSVYIITHGDERTRPEHFDPQTVAAFKSCHPRLREIYEELVA